MKAMLRFKQNNEQTNIQRLN